MRSAYFNYSLINESHASLAISNRGFLFGEGVFRTLRVSKGQVFYWQKHFQKLNADCQFLSLPSPAISEEDMQNLIVENGAFNGTWRLKIIVSDSLIITLEPYNFSQVEKHLTVFPHSIERPSAKVKSLSYLDNMLVSKYALENGYDDGLILNHEKAILECSKANFLWAHHGSLYFSDPSLPYYEGVMQQLCLETATQLGMKTLPCKFKLEDIPSNAFLFTSNAMQGLIPITKIDERIFPRNLEMEEEFGQRLNSL